MKTLLLTLACSFFVYAGSAQLQSTPVCPPFLIDVLEGIINDKLDCNSTLGEIQKTFPCFTDSAAEKNMHACGAVFYIEKDITFFTERDYIEIGENFKGRLTPALLGMPRNGLFKLLGNPQIKDINWDAYRTKYGILVLYYNKAGKVNKLQMSSKNAESLKLCE